MAMIKVIAPKGHGKTLFTTYAALFDYAAGKDIYTNYNLNFPTGPGFGTVRMLTPEILFDITNEQLNNCVLLLDEIGAFMDSRMSGKKENRILSYLMMQSRKRDVDIYGTAQHSSIVDLRFRYNTEYDVRPRMRGDYLTWKMYDGYTGRLINKYGVIASYLYDMYDTDEIINPVDWEMGKKRDPIPKEWKKGIDAAKERREWQIKPEPKRPVEIQMPKQSPKHSESVSKLEQIGKELKEHGKQKGNWIT